MPDAVEDACYVEQGYCCTLLSVDRCSGVVFHTGHLQNGLVPAPQNARCVGGYAGEALEKWEELLLEQLGDRAYEGYRSVTLRASWTLPSHGQQDTRPPSTPGGKEPGGRSGCFYKQNVVG